MKNISKYLVLIVGFVISCTNGTKSQSTINQNSEMPNSGNPETSERNTSIPPAFEGQTRAKGIQTRTELNSEVINSDLGRPWGIVDFPENRFLVTDKSGFMHLVSSDGKTIKKITGLPKVDDSGQGGLLDVVLDPDFQKNRTVFWSFSEPYSGGNHTAVAKGVLSSDEQKLEKIQIIFRATPTYDGKLHYGSRLAFAKDGNLFVSTGERSDRETRPLAQDNSTFLGKIVKITKDGKPAPGNPTLSGWKPQIYSTGHRNPQGIAIHPETGELWEAEMGPKGGDEVNRILPGKNYGWPTITYGEEYSGSTIGEGIGKKEGLEQPVYFWDPSISMSGIDFYKGNIEEWKNDLFLGCLSGQKIIRLKIENNKVIGEEWLLEDKNERFRDVLSSSDGNLYAITDSGKLYKISKK